MADQLFPVKSGFYDAVNNDRTYNAEDMNKPYSRLVSDGVFANPDGTPSNDFLVEPNSGMSIKVGIGQGIIAHKWFQNDTPISIAVPTNTGLTTRIDSVILQVDNRTATRAGAVVYRVGTSSPPALDSATTEYRLANISIAAGTSTITAAMITDLRGSAECPWIAALIQQPDLSTLWQNFYDAYEQAFGIYEAEMNDSQSEIQQAWDDFFDQLTENLNVTMNLATLKNTYTATGTVTTIPIGITGYNSSTDLLLVFINGLLASPSMYTVSGSNVVLTNSIAAGNKVDFLVLKSVVSADVSSTISLLQQFSSALTAFMSDSGWQDIELKNGAQKVNDASKPQVRNIGGRVYIKGAIRTPPADYTVFGTLPNNCKPDGNHVYTVCVNVADVASVICMITIASNGNMVINCRSDTIPVSGYLFIDTCYLAADAPTAVIVPDLPSADEEEF